MSLIPCSDCGREISSLAPACVHCGRPTVPVRAYAVAPYRAAAPVACPLCGAAVTHPNARTGGAAWCERCGGQMIFGTDGALVRAVPRSSVPLVHPPQHVQQVVYVGKQKSVGTAIALAFLFGPLGMFYSTVSGALIMCVVTLFAMLATFGMALFVTAPICMIWAANAASEHNRRQVYALNAAA
jgi:uncharacterized paraquat-inducible protein A